MRVARSSGLRGKIISHPSAILLVVQLIGVLVYPFMEDTTDGRVVFEIFGALVLALAIWSVRESPGPTWIVDRPRGGRVLPVHRRRGQPQPDT